MAMGREVGVLDRVFAKAKRGKRLRSDLAKELTRQHDEFAARLSAGEASGTPYDWESLAEGFRREGYTAARGARLTGDRLRRTWARVSDRVRRARDRASAAVAVVPVTEAAPEIPVSPGPSRNSAVPEPRLEWREDEPEKAEPGGYRFGMGSPLARSGGAKKEGQDDG